MTKKLVSAGWIMGWAFSLMGGLFTFSGAVWWHDPRDPELQIYGPIPVLAGAVLLVIGLSLLFSELMRRRRARELMESGRYIWGQIAALEPNTMIRINNRYPYYALVRCRSPRGTVLTFRSISSMGLRHRDDLTGCQVKVYIGDDTYKRYHVDINSIL